MMAVAGLGGFKVVKQWIVAFFTPAPDSAVANDVRKGKSPWTDAIHLLWSVWIFVTPLFGHFDRRWVWATLITYPVFLLLYAKACLASRRRVHWNALALVVLALLALPWYPSALTYFVFGCVMMCNCRMSLRAYLATLAGLNVVCLAEAWLLGYQGEFLFTIPVMTLVIGLIINTERSNQARDAELQLSHDEVRRLAATAERERIGRDLHDLLGHTLSLITLKLELSRKLFDRDVEAAKREVAEAEKVARHALAEVRCAVTGIRATDIAAELASARLLLESSGVHLVYDHPPGDLPGDVERGLSLILREAATNIARHADARSARIEWRRERASVCMKISDDGRGGVDHDGNGLGGMRERVRALGGVISIESPRGRGTCLKVSAPVPILRLVEPAPTAVDSSTEVTRSNAFSGQPAA